MASVNACEDDSPKMEPKRTLTPALAPTPPVPLREVVKMERKRAPSPRTQANTDPITVSSALALRPRTAITMATAMHPP
jgi:hypothetical protein